MPTGIPVHKLSNINMAKLTADCAKCGVDSSIKLKSDRVRCRGSIKESRKKCKNQGSTYKHGIPRNIATELRVDASCFICGSIKNLHIDHSHETGNLRGILCSNHNLALGLFKDNTDHLFVAIQYLINPPGVEFGNDKG